MASEEELPKFDFHLRYKRADFPQPVPLSGISAEAVEKALRYAHSCYGWSMARLEPVLAKELGEMRVGKIFEYEDERYYLLRIKRIS